MDTEEIHVEKHIRREDNSWLLTDYRRMEDFFTIETVQVSLQLKDVYDGVPFE